MKVISAPQTINAAAPATFARAGTAWWFDYAGVLQSAGTNVLRFNWNKETNAYEGCLVEAAATNIFLNNATVGTRAGVSVANATTYTLSFYGDAGGGSTTITLSGAATGTLVSAGPNKRVTKTFTTTSTSLNMTVSGAGVGKHGQLELGPYATSVIVTGGAQVTRNADVITGTGVFYNGFVDTTQVYPAGSPYIIKEVVQYGGRRYESVVAQAPGPTPGTDPTAWLDIGPSNDTAAFDMRSSTRSVGDNAEEVICIYADTAVDAIGIMGLVNCNYVHAILRWNMTVAPTTLYKGGYPRNALLTSPTPGKYLTIVLNNDIMGPPSPPAPEVGEIVLGTLFDLGFSQYGLEWTLVDYSKVDEAYDAVTFTRGKNVKLLTGAVEVLTADYNAVTDMLASLTATPTVWLGSDVAAYESGMLTFAFMKAARMGPPNAVKSILRIDLQGLT